MPAVALHQHSLVLGPRLLGYRFADRLLAVRIVLDRLCSYLLVDRWLRCLQNVRGIPAVLSVEKVRAGRACENVAGVDPAHCCVRPAVVVLEAAVANHGLTGTLRAASTRIFAPFLLDNLIGTHLLCIRGLLLDRLHVKLLRVNDRRFGTLALCWLLETSSHQPLVDSLAERLVTALFALMLERRELLLMGGRRDHLVHEGLLRGDVVLAHEIVVWRV